MESKHSKKTRVRLQRKTDYLLQDATVGQFLALTNLPIPILDTSKIAYYLNLFEPHYHSQTLWNLFVETLEMLETLTPPTQIGSYQAKVKEQLRMFLDQFEPIAKAFVHVDDTKSFFESSRESAISKKDIYSVNNANKHYVSFDVKEANFQTIAWIIRQKDPSFPETWKECVALFTKSTFFQECKYFRQIVLGKTKLSRYYGKLCPQIFTHPLLKIVQESKLFGTAVPVCILHDEFIYQVEKYPDQKNLDDLLAQVKGQRWNITKFYLHLLSKQHGYFVKVIELEKDVLQRHLKCVQKAHACQAVKKDLGQEITDEDLYFLSTTGETAKFIHPTIF